MQVGQFSTIINGAVLDNITFDAAPNETIGNIETTHAEALLLLIDFTSGTSGDLFFVVEIVGPDGLFYPLPLNPALAAHDAGVRTIAAANEGTLAWVIEGVIGHAQVRVRSDIGGNGTVSMRAAPLNT
jgi:hypothetical protein